MVCQFYVKENDNSLFLLLEHLEKDLIDHKSRLQDLKNLI